MLVAVVSVETPGGSGLDARKSHVEVRQGNSDVFVVRVAYVCLFGVVTAGKGDLIGITE